MDVHVLFCNKKEQPPRSETPPPACGKSARLRASGRALCWPRQGGMPSHSLCLLMRVQGLWGVCTEARVQVRHGSKTVTGQRMGAFSLSELTT